MVTLNASLNRIANVDSLAGCKAIQMCWIDQNLISVAPDFRRLMPHVQDLQVNFGPKQQNAFSKGLDEFQWGFAAAERRISFDWGDGAGAAHRDEGR